MTLLHAGPGVTGDFFSVRSDCSGNRNDVRPLSDASYTISVVLPVLALAHTRGARKLRRASFLAHAWLDCDHAVRHLRTWQCYKDKVRGSALQWNVPERGEGTPRQLAAVTGAPEIDHKKATAERGTTKRVYFHMRCKRSLDFVGYGESSDGSSQVLGTLICDHP